MLFMKFDSLTIEAWQHANEYDLKHDRISNPGKFEGECRYVPYFYTLAMNGGADTEYPECEACNSVENDCMDCSPQHIDSIEVDHVDRILYPELKHVEVVKIGYSDSGFVYEV